VPAKNYAKNFQGHMQCTQQQQQQSKWGGGCWAVVGGGRGIMRLRHFPRRAHAATPPISLPHANSLSVVTAKRA